MPWEPNQYLKFKQQRFEPFSDLIKLVNVRAGLDVVDLGCGTGELTVKLAELLLDCSVVGIDNSTNMLEKANAIEGTTARFELGSIESLAHQPDLIFSNAAIHWVDDHEALIPRLFSLVKPGGQLVVQLPSQQYNRANTIIKQVAGEEPFNQLLDGWIWNYPVLPLDMYAEMLYNNGGQSVTVFEKVYMHTLKNAEAILEWISGTSMIPYLERLPESEHRSFKNRILELLTDRWDSEPVYFPFRRILFSATKKM